jgi:hypothetical protein
MFRDGRITAAQRQSLMLCLPKGTCGWKRGLWTISLLNTDDKLLARIMANRRRLTLAVVIHSDQCCGVPGRKSVDAKEDIPDVRTWQISRRKLWIVFRAMYDGPHFLYLAVAFVLVHYRQGGQFNKGVFHEWYCSHLLCTRCSFR